MGWPHDCPIASEVSLKDMSKHIDGLVQERRNSNVLAMELRLSCINPSISDESKEIATTTKQITTNCMYIIWDTLHI